MRLTRRVTENRKGATVVSQVVTLSHTLLLLHLVGALDALLLRCSRDPSFKFCEANYKRLNYHICGVFIQRLSEYLDLTHNLQWEVNNDSLIPFWMQNHYHRTHSFPFAFLSASGSLSTYGQHFNYRIVYLRICDFTKICAEGETRTLKTLRSVVFETTAYTIPPLRLSSELPSVVCRFIQLDKISLNPSVLLLSNFLLEIWQRHCTIITILSLDYQKKLI